MLNKIKYQNVFLSLGSNLGNREENILTAIKLINEINSTKVINRSKLYETEPVGYLEQPNFLNLALKIETSLNPTELLCSLKEIEKKIGRIEREKWHEREIDIDIIFFDDQIINLPNLHIPHKHSHMRQFVLEPIAEIDANFIHPIFHKTIKNLLNKII